MNNKDELTESFQSKEPLYKNSLEHEDMSLSFVNEALVNTPSPGGTLLLRLSGGDLRGLRFQPRYVTHGLLGCAPIVAQHPTAIYRGLKRGERCPVRLQYGWAICGKPDKTFDNEGIERLAPSGLLYILFADAEGLVFDWDWILEDPNMLGHPLDNELRFGDPINLNIDLILDLPPISVEGNFNPDLATFSAIGDCVFCYLSDAPSYARRVNEDLTVFYDLDEQRRITGFKIKNVSRILQEEQKIRMDDAEGLNVLVVPLLRKAYPEHREVVIMLYELLIAAFVRVKIRREAPDEGQVIASY